MGAAQPRYRRHEAGGGGRGEEVADARSVRKGHKFAHPGALATRWRVVSPVRKWSAPTGMATEPVTRRGPAGRVRLRPLSKETLPPAQAQQLRPEEQQQDRRERHPDHRCGDDEHHQEKCRGGGQQGLGGEGQVCDFVLHGALVGLGVSLWYARESGQEGGIGLAARRAMGNGVFGCGGLNQARGNPDASVKRRRDCLGAGLAQSVGMRTKGKARRAARPAEVRPPYRRAG